MKASFRPADRPARRPDDRRLPDGRSPEIHFSEARRTGVGPELELETLSAAIAIGDDLPRDVKLHVNLSPPGSSTPIA